VLIRLDWLKEGLLLRRLRWVMMGILATPNPIVILRFRIE